ncbi:MAG: sugar phosphate isomerase/epimerase [Candidatus Hydrogenedentes bacterium]|nr:sugar phosphate isomerase/epimerase [Candidatus Hydrogenedentota bacterium]
MSTSRRQFIAGTLTAAALGSFAPGRAANTKPRIKIGACDWSIGMTANPAALDIAKTIGLDGVQVSLGNLANDMHLRRTEMQDQYKAAVATTGIEVLSLAIGELNNIPYKSDPRTIAWVSDSIDVCGALGCRVVLLAFFHHGDLRNDPAGTDETVRRLRDVAPKAEKKGVVLGIESWLSAEDHMRIIDRVGSPSVKVYYDVANSTERGYDIDKEIRWLGKQGQICEFHMKEDGSLLGEGRVDFAKVRAAIDDIGYSGPVQIEGAVPPGGDVIESYIANRKYLQRTFAPAETSTN